MQELVRKISGRESELQLPAIATYPPEGLDSAATADPTNDTIRIVYAGAGVKCAEKLVRVVKSGQLEQNGIRRCSVDLFVPLTNECFYELGWKHEFINLHGWVSGSELQEALSVAHILFLPMSFDGHDRRVVEVGFPTKTTDYLASGRPILVFAPEYSSLVRYARQFRFAEIVTEPSDDALAKGISALANSAAYRKELLSRARSVLSMNHNICKQKERFYQLVSELALGYKQPQTCSSTGQFQSFP